MLEKVKFYSKEEKRQRKVWQTNGKNEKDNLQNWKNVL